MDSAKLNDWMQVVGIFALVASLVFVGLQMKQSQEIAIAAQYHDRAALAVENFHAIVESGNTARAGENCADETTADRSLEEIGRSCLQANAYLVMADNHLYQYESGFMDESAWQAQRALLGILLNGSDDAFRSAYQSTRLIRRVSFRRLCDQLIAEGKANSEAK